MPFIILAFPLSLHSFWKVCKVGFYRQQWPVDNWNRVIKNGIGIRRKRNGVIKKIKLGVSYFKGCLSWLQIWDLAPMYFKSDWSPLWEGHFLYQFSLGTSFEKILLAAPSLSRSEYKNKDYDELKSLVFMSVVLMWRAIYFYPKRNSEPDWFSGS